MKIMIAFGTIEGQTRKIAEFVAQMLAQTGAETVMVDTLDRTDNPGFEGIDKVILAASVHERRHPETFEVFVGANRAALAQKPVLLLSISLKAAFAQGREEAQDYVDEMKLRTRLDPDQELLVAGAICSESYDFYAAQVLRHVVLAGQDFDPSVRDQEFTDWAEVRAAVAAFVGPAAV